MPKFGDGIFSTVTVLDGANHWIQLPKLTTTQRNALTGVNGLMIYNSTTGQVEVYANGSWKATGAEAVATHAALTTAHGSSGVVIGQTTLNTHIADLDAHTLNPYETYKVGRYVRGGVDGQVADMNMQQYRIWGFYLVITRTMTFDRIAIEVTTLSNGDDIRLGIYECSSAIVPGALVLDAGTVDTDSAAVKAITINQQLTRGRYFLAAITNSTVARVRQNYVSNTNFGCLALHQGGTHFYFNGDAADFAALPDPCDAPTAYIDYGPIVGLRAASMD